MAAWVFALPLSSFGLGTGPLGLAPHQLATLAFMPFIGASWLVRSPRARIPVSRTNRVLFVMMGCWFGVSLISLLWVPEISGGYDIKSPLNILEYTLFIAVFVFATYDRAILKAAYVSYLCSALSLLIVNMVNSFGLYAIPGYTRTRVMDISGMKVGVLALFQQMEAYAGWTLPLLAWAAIVIWGSYRSRAAKLTTLAAFPLLTIGASLGGSRSTWFAAALALPISVGLVESTHRHKARRARLWFFILLSTVAAVASAPFVEDIVDSAIAIRPTTVSGREQGYAIALNLSTETLQGLLFGAGKDRFVAANGGEVAHNSLLDELVTNGLVGVSILITLVVAVVRMGMRAKRVFDAVQDPLLSEVALTASAGLMLIFAEGLFANVTPLYAVWLMVGFIAGLSQLAPAAMARRQVGPVRGAFVGSQVGIQIS